MALGEYESERLLAKHIPEHIPPMVAWGSLKANPNHGFVLSEFREMKSGILVPETAASIMHRIHSHSAPNGKFGFPVTTFKGLARLDNAWCNTWEELFTRQFRSELAWEQIVRGDDAEYGELCDAFVNEVVPRLLRPLQSNGRSIEPVLCHGDLWHGNVEFDVKTGTPVLFDAACCYGHHECK
jgi:protein-ribulosamine 3-kinase